MNSCETCETMVLDALKLKSVWDEVLFRDWVRLTISRARRCLKRKPRHLRRNIRAYLSKDTRASATNIPTWKRNKIFERCGGMFRLRSAPVRFYGKIAKLEEFLLERILHKIVLRNIAKQKTECFSNSWRRAWDFETRKNILRLRACATHTSRYS